MPVRFTLGSEITIDGITYKFSEHPMARGMLYGQTGRRATVYKIHSSIYEDRALKVFNKAFRTTRNSANINKLRAFSNLPGLKVCSRAVITPVTHARLLQINPDLEYAVLMPWMRGETWQESILSHRPLTREQGLRIAMAFLEMLTTMEDQHLAHCDLSGPNVLIESSSEEPVISLVDVEDIYAPTLNPPENLGTGSAGYGHKTAIQGIWNENADRFAGVVLLTEILGWHDDSVRRIAYGEQYFDPQEVQQSGDRFNVLCTALEKAWGKAVRELFVDAWFSESLSRCPSFHQWKNVLESPGNSGQDPRVHRLPAINLTSSTGQLNDTEQYIYDSFLAQLDLKNFEQAHKLASALKALLPDFEEPSRILEESESRYASERTEQRAQLENALQQNREGLSQLAEQRTKLETARLEIEQQISHVDQVERHLLAEKEQISNQLKAFGVLNPLSQSQKPTDPPVVKRASSLSTSSVKYKNARLHLQSVLAHQNAVLDAFFMEHEAEFISIDVTGKSILWDSTGIQLVSDDLLNTNNKTITAVCFSEANNFMALGLNEGSLRIWDIPSHRLTTLKLDGQVRKLQFLHTKNQLVAGTSHGVSRYAKSGSLQNSTPLDDLVDFSLSRDDTFLAFRSSRNELVLMNSGADRIATMPLGKNSVFGFAPECNLLCFVDSSECIALLDAETLQIKQQFRKVEKSSICALAISADVQLLVTGNTDGKIDLWRLRDGKLLDTAETHTDKINSLHFNSDGSYVISSSADCRAVLWKTSHG